MAFRAIAISVTLSTLLAASTAMAEDEPPIVPVGLPPPPGAPPRGGPPPPPQATTLFSPAMVGIGSALVVGGITTTVTGSVLFWLNGRNVYEMAVSAAHGPDTAAIISGGILVLIGIPLIAIGAQKVAVGPEPVARLVPTIAPSRGGAALTWRF